MGSTVNLSVGSIVLLTFLVLVIGISLAEFALWRVRTTLVRVTTAQEQERREGLLLAHERNIEREEIIDVRERELVADLRSVVAEFRGILDAMGAIAPPETWEASKAPLVMRLEHIDSKLASKSAAIAAA